VGFHATSAKLSEEIGRQLGNEHQSINCNWIAATAAPDCSAQGGSHVVFENSL
jgi:hypothetical protein